MEWNINNGMLNSQKVLIIYINKTQYKYNAIMKKKEKGRATDARQH